MASGSGASSTSKSAGPIGSIYFEKQFGLLCAEHCINNALQEKAVDAVMLSEYGRRIDAAERQVAYDEGRQFEGQNYDDSGYFSVQVIESALAPYDLRLIPINEGSSLAAVAKKKPEAQRLFIFHEKDHWFCARRFAEKQWVLLNSLNDGPLEIPDSQLLSTVASGGGRHVFLVAGDLKKCQADEVYAGVMKDSEGKTRVFTDKGQTLSGGTGRSSEEAEMEEAVALSLGKSPQELLREKRANFLANLERQRQQGQEQNDK